MPERAALVQSNVAGLVALDLILRIVRTGVMDVTFIIHVLCVHPHNTAAYPAGFGVPADVIADLECLGHGACRKRFRWYKREARFWFHEDRRSPGRNVYAGLSALVSMVMPASMTSVPSILKPACRRASST